MKWITLRSLCLLMVLCARPALAADDSATQQKLNRLNADIERKRSENDGLEEKINTYRENLKTKQQEKLNLTSQLEVIDQDIIINETEIEQTGNEIETLGLQIDQLAIDIATTTEQVDDKKGQISALVLDLYNFEQQTYLEVALTHQTLSEFSEQVEYTEKVNTQFTKALLDLQALKQQLQEDQDVLSDRQQTAEEKEQELEVRQDSLAGEKNYKKNLLTEVQNDEAKFQQLVKNLQDEQTAVHSELSALEKSARTTLDQLTKAQTGSGINDNANFTLPTEFQPIWPVNGVITTTFHDPNYIFRRYFEHDAIDIAAPQGTPLKAADSGVVAVVRFDGSPSYAYVMIVHADNFATVYGHVSGIAPNIEPDQPVNQGQVVAYVGGLPGTTGAGAFSTGSHVHFSVLLNGIPVDPMLYLP